MEINSQTGLVLEGGGMRAIFTVGVDRKSTRLNSSHNVASRMLPASGDDLVLAISNY